MRKKRNPEDAILPAPVSSAPVVNLENCTFAATDSAGVLALARALEANAHAIHELAKSMGQHAPLLTIGNGKA